MNALDLLFWALRVCLARASCAIRPAPPADWALLGLVLGLGPAEQGERALADGRRLSAGLLTTRHRRLLATPGPWLAVVARGRPRRAAHLWQVTHGWPTREFVQHATEDKMAAVSLSSFLRAQVDDMHPLTALLWIPGLAALLTWRRLSAFRPLGIAYVAIFALLVLNEKSRAGYLAPMYPVLFAAGAVALRGRDARPAMGRPGVGALLVLGGAAVAPMALPVLPVETFVAYAAALGQKPESEEKKEMGRLPQYYADMFGWREMTDAVSRVVATLPPAERAHAVIRGERLRTGGRVRALRARAAAGRLRAQQLLASGGRAIRSPTSRCASATRRRAEVWTREVYRECEKRGVFENPVGDAVREPPRHLRLPVPARDARRALAQGEALGERTVNLGSDRWQLTARDAQGSLHDPLRTGDTSPAPRRGGRGRHRYALRSLARALDRLAPSPALGGARSARPASRRDAGRRARGPLVQVAPTPVQPARTGCPAGTGRGRPGCPRGCAPASRSRTPGPARSPCSSRKSVARAARREEERRELLGEDVVRADREPGLARHLVVVVDGASAAGGSCTR